MEKIRNRRIILVSRPVGTPTADNFKLEDSDVPDPSNGQMLLRTLYLSLDPYMRGRMSDAPSYAEHVALRGVMVGGTVSQVVDSKIPEYKPGDRVLSYSGWQEYALTDGTGIVKIDQTDEFPISYALGVLGMPGHTAYTGLLQIGKPKTNETIVVAAASGAVGSVVGQIAKIKGCRAVGIAGSKTKCDYVTQTLGFDACINYKNEDFKAKLQEVCPDGIDIYFESVGGEVQQTVWPLLNVGARVPVCGIIAHYNARELPQGPDRTPLILRDILTKRITVKGFIIFDHQADFPEMTAKIKQWLSQGRIVYKEDVVDGLERAPESFIGLLNGLNFGKLIVKVADPK
jgi:NADPH-dependent curcumin reductase